MNRWLNHMFGFLLLSLVCGLPAISSAQEAGHEHQTGAGQNEGFFTTRENATTLELPGDEEAFSFIMYGDRTGGNREGLAVLRQAVKDTNLMAPDFVWTVGDLIQGYNRPEDWQPEADEFKEIMSGLSTNWFPVAGNHDIYWEFRDPDRPREHHEKNYEATFGPLWYSFQHKATGFITLFSDEGDLETGEKGFNRGRMQNMSPEQLDFLKQALEQFKDLNRVFVTLHHPRWIGGGYEGSNWPDVHKILVDAGNVTAVFAGHIHRMRFDPQDGIDYYALATTGGHLSADLPAAGYLHHFNIVTVRQDSYSVATIPVGTVIDPKKFTAEFLADVERVNQMRPTRIGDRLEMSLRATTAQKYRIAVPNPGMHPLEVTVVPEGDVDWQIVPDHQHLIVEPGQTREMEFFFYRKPERANADDPWFGFESPVLTCSSDYLHDSARIAIPPQTIPVDLGLKMADSGFAEDLQKCLSLRGVQTQSNRREQKIRSDCARVNSADLKLEQGPFTVEAWVYPTNADESRAVVAKTQSSEFAIFLHNGFAQFDVHFGDGYVSPKSPDKLPLNEWSHLAGVYDGSKLILFVNGINVASSRGSGNRTRNELPLYIGADPDGSGSPVRQFAGKLDEIRISSVARYAENFQPAARMTRDDATVLLLHMDRKAGPFLIDDSPNQTPVTLFGRSAIESRE